ncbi:MAG: emp24/gp25L/p24 family protein [Dehalococcoidia bacterium]
MKKLLALVILGGLLTGVLATGWFVMNYWAPSGVGTPAHAGIVSNGRPQQCTNLNINVRPRAQATRTVLLEGGDLLRGTFEANGGWGNVDILLRIVSPQGLELLASPRAENYDFTLPAKFRGEYTFVLDNRYSLYTAKSVGLYYCVDGGEPFLPTPGP